MKNFMKATLFFAMINSIVIGSVYTQEIDLEDINQTIREGESANKKAKRLAKLERKKKREERKEKRSPYLVSTDIFSRKFPQKKKLVGIDKNYKRLFKCMRNVADHKKGGVDGLIVLAQLVENLYNNSGLIKDSYLIDEAFNTCRKLKSGALKDRTFDVTDLDVIANYRYTTKKFLEDFYDVSLDTCETRTIYAEAGAIGMAQASFGYTRCLLSNGRVRNYLGFGVGIGFGAGASVGSSRLTNGTWSTQKPTKALRFELLDAEAGNGAFDLFYQRYQNNDNWYSSSGVNGEFEQEDRFLIGLSAKFVPPMGGMLSMRLLPNSNRWHYLINKLK